VDFGAAVDRDRADRDGVHLPLQAAQLPEGADLAPAAQLLYTKVIWTWDHTRGSQKMLCVVASLVDPRGPTDKWTSALAVEGLRRRERLAVDSPTMKREDDEDTDPRPIASSEDDEAGRRVAASRGRGESRVNPSS
jgi:hypothetical protein